MYIIRTLTKTKQVAVPFWCLNTSREAPSALGFAESRIPSPFYLMTRDMFDRDEEKSGLIMIDPLT